MKSKSRFWLAAFAAILTVGSAFPSLAKSRLETPSGLYWSNTTKDDADDEDEGSYARWDAVENVHQYEVTLRREDADGDTSTVDTIKTKKTSFNFRSRMNKEGEYSFRVRALAKGSSYSDSYWSDYSDQHYVSESGAQNAGDSGTEASIVKRRGWVLDAQGWWYEKDDGTWPADGWFQDPASGLWYYMNGQGYMQTGWITKDYGNGPVYYYCDPDGTPQGAMLAGCTATVNGVSYTFNSDGAVVTGGSGASGETVSEAAETTAAETAEAVAETTEAATETTAASTTAVDEYIGEVSDDSDD